LSTTIGFIDTTTDRTGATCIPWVHWAHRNASLLSLVFDEATKLKERPITVLVPLLAANRSLTDALKVFQGDTSVSVLRFLNKPLTNRMIDVCLKTGLTARQLTKFAFRRLGLLALKITAAVFVLPAVTFHYLTVKIFSITIRRKIDNAKVYPQKVVNIKLIRFLKVTGDEQVERSVDVNEVAFPKLTPQELALMFSTSEGDMLTTRNRPNGNLGVFEFKGKEPIIECDCTQHFKCTLDFLIKFVSIGNLGNTAYNYLSSKIELFTNRIVSQFMEWKLAKGFAPPRLFTDEIAGTVGLNHRCFKRGSLFVSGKQFYFRSQFHNSNNRLNVLFRQYKERRERV